MISTTDGWAVGYDSINDGGVILHWDGNTWSETTNPDTSIYLTDVAMASSDDGWAVGNYYAIFHWDGSNWSVWDYAYPSNGFIYDIEMVSPTDGWAVGSFGSIMHWNGSSWEYTTGLDSSRPTLYSTSMISDSSGWMVGSTSAVLSYSSNTWSDINLPFDQGLRDLDFVSADDGWAIGDFGIILNWNGTIWSEVSSPVTTHLNDVFMISSTEGWIVGDSGVILRWNGIEWSSVTSPTIDTLYSISTGSSTDGWVVGAGDYFYRWNGVTWDEYPSPNNMPFYSVDMVSDSDGWAVGGVFIGDPNWLSGYIYHWDGGSWTKVSSSTPYQYLYSVDVFDSSNVWVAGDQYNTTEGQFENTVIKWNGSSFYEVYNVSSQAIGLFQDIHALSPSDVWVVGGQANISHWDGTKWDQIESPTNKYFEAVSMVSNDEGWIVGNDGVILVYSPAATLDINYSSGAPGSFFTLTGENFPINSTVWVSVNGRLLGTVQSDSQGSFTFLLDTSQANEGIYFVDASVNPSVRVRFDLDASEPSRTQEGSGTIFEVPEGIQFVDLVYIPLVIR